MRNLYDIEQGASEHGTFRGLIYPSDFETNYPRHNCYNGSEIARRIISDWIFDDQCQKNIEARNRRAAYANKC